MLAFPCFASSLQVSPTIELTSFLFSLRMLERIFNLRLNEIEVLLDLTLKPNCYKLLLVRWPGVTPSKPESTFPGRGGGLPGSVSRHNACAVCTQCTPRRKQLLQ